MALATNQCLIRAAGNGCGLVSQSGGYPKATAAASWHAVTRAHGAQCCEAGLDEFVIVLGFHGQMIRGWFASHWLSSVPVTWAET